MGPINGEDLAQDAEAFKDMIVKSDALTSEKQTIISKFDINDMFNVYIGMHKIDPRKTSQATMTAIRKSFYSAVAQTIVLTAMAMEQNQFPPNELMQRILNQVNDYFVKLK
jgi:hypothetical protein